MPILRPSGPPSRELVTAVGFYRELGFFSAFGAVPHEECAAKLLAAHRSEWDVDLVPLDSYDDAVLLSYDGKRAWFEDTALDSRQDHLVYPELLEDWAHVSRGSFHPEDVEESWKGPRGPIAVTFTHGGTRHALAPKWNEGLVDLDLLTPLNAIVGASGMGFCCLRIDQSALIVVLTPTERARIERERHWRFE